MKKNKTIIFMTAFIFCFLFIFLEKKIPSVNENNLSTLNSFVKTFHADGGCYTIVNAANEQIIDEACIKTNRNISITTEGFKKSFYAIALKNNENKYTKKQIYDYLSQYIFSSSETLTIKQLTSSYVKFLQNKNNYIEQKYIKNIMAKNVTEGTAKKANIEGANIHGLTSTTTLPNKNNITTFIGNFSHNDHDYVVVALLVSPKGLKTTFGYNSAGWNSVPLAAELIKNIMGDS
ncbi:MAG: hypothetical protein J6K16_06110 [Alphaproteobacteria bacterium]|nr:hypothetical protein [Alphaproteobacteria bacterium]